MSLYENWMKAAYTQEGQINKRVWDEYLPLEQAVYEKLIGEKITHVEGTVAELSKTYNMPANFICGFIDGLSDILDPAVDLEALEEDTPVSISLDFEKLYKKMVEYKAEHLYNLPQWDNVFTEEQRKEFFNAQKRSRTVYKEAEPSRNDPCPCGSGKKYKKCCGAAK